MCFLTWIGQCPVEDIFAFVGQIATIYYYAFFMVLVPVVGKIESALLWYRKPRLKSFNLKGPQLFSAVMDQTLATDGSSSPLVLLIVFVVVSAPTLFNMMRGQRNQNQDQESNQNQDLETGPSVWDATSPYDLDSLPSDLINGDGSIDHYRRLLRMFLDLEWCWFDEPLHEHLIEDFNPGIAPSLVRRIALFNEVAYEHIAKVCVGSREELEGGIMTFLKELATTAASTLLEQNRGCLDPYALELYSMNRLELLYPTNFEIALCEHICELNFGLRSANEAYYLLKLFTFYTMESEATAMTIIMRHTLENAGGMV